MFTEKITEYEALVESLRAENNLLKNQEPQTIEKTIEKTIEVEKPLCGSQFICELEEKTAYDARKIRSFAVKDGFVEFESDKDYPNKLANVAVRQFINRHYADHID